MANEKAYYTTNDIIESIKRSANIPVVQNLYTATDIIKMINEEMLIEQVPAVLSYHEEYYVFSQTVPLEANLSRYPIPKRAVGMRLRDLMYLDTSGNLSEMARVNATDKAHFQRSSSSTSGLHKFYLEGNEVVLTPSISSNPQGSLVFSYYIRPNKLVEDSRAAVSSSISDAITIISKSCMPADLNTGTGTFTITAHGFSDTFRVRVSNTGTLPSELNANTDYYIVNKTDNTFQLSATRGGSAITYTSAGTGVFTITRYPESSIEFTSGDFDTTNSRINKANSFSNGDKVMLSSTGTLPAEFSDNRIYYIVNSSATYFSLSLTSGGSAITFQSIGSGTMTITTELSVITCTDTIPTNIVNGSTVDFLQTDSGNRILDIDITIPDNAISGSTITLRTADIPDSFIVGDYICLSGEAIIPYLPNDLHYGLAERTCARILAGINDKEGLAISNTKLQKIERSEERLLDNRVEGSPEKINNRHSLLRMGRISHRRRF